MQAGPSPAREARVRHRQGIRTLTYVTLDQGNGGILLNLTRNGAAVQTVAATRNGQQVQVRFDLLAPRVRVNVHGEVVWATPSGRCGIRFLDLSPQTARQLDEWTFAKLLEGASPLSSPESVFARANRSLAVTVKDPISEPAGTRRDEGEGSGQQYKDEESLESNDANGEDLIISPGRVKTIDLLGMKESVPTERSVSSGTVVEEQFPKLSVQLDWLSQPLSGRSLAWTVNGLIVTAAWLLCVLVFLSVLREIPKWPVAMVSGAGIAVAGMYWGFFRMFAGASLGAKLAQLTEAQQDQSDFKNRFR